MLLQRGQPQPTPLAGLVFPGINGQIAQLFHEQLGPEVCSALAQVNRGGYEKAHCEGRAVSARLDASGTPQQVATDLACVSHLATVRQHQSGLGTGIVMMRGRVPVQRATVAALQQERQAFQHIQALPEMAQSLQVGPHISRVTFDETFKFGIDDPLFAYVRPSLTNLQTLTLNCPLTYKELTLALRLHQLRCLEADDIDLRYDAYKTKEWTVEHLVLKKAEEVDGLMLNRLPKPKTQERITLAFPDDCRLVLRIAEQVRPLVLSVLYERSAVLLCTVSA